MHAVTKDTRVPIAIEKVHSYIEVRKSIAMRRKKAKKWVSASKLL